MLENPSAPSRHLRVVPATALGLVLAVGGIALAQQDKYTLQVPGGLALSECRGYEDWPAVAVSHPEATMGASSCPTTSST